MRKNNQGISLLESLIATAILAANIIFYINFQTTVTSKRVKHKTLDIVADASRVIKEAVTNRAICSQLMLDHGPDAPAGTPATFTDIKKVTTNKITNNPDEIDENTFTESGTQKIIPLELGNGVEIESHQVIADAGEYYLETTFKLDTKNSKDIGAETTKRRFLLNARVDLTNPTQKFIECNDVTTSQIRSVAQLTCQTQDGVSQPGTDACVDPDDLSSGGGGPPGGEDRPEECGPGAEYKLTYTSEDGLQMKCKPCVPQTKFVRWDCRKGKDIGLHGVNWVNVCYYRTGCQNDPIADFGEEFFTQGPTKARGGDTGTRRRCKKRRKSCDGEKVARENSEEIAIRSSNNAQAYLNEVQTLVNTFNQNVDAGEMNKIDMNFSDLKVKADDVVYEADRSAKAADISKSDKAKRAAGKAIRAKEEAKRIFEEALEIYRNLN